MHWIRDENQKTWNACSAARKIVNEEQRLSRESEQQLHAWKFLHCSTTTTNTETKSSSSKRQRVDSESDDEVAGAIAVMTERVKTVVEFTTDVEFLTDRDGDTNIV